MEPTKGKYLPQLDIIRACAFIFVVLLHYSVPTWDAITNKLGTITESLIRGGWLGVCLFLFVSGYSLALGKTHLDSTINLKNFYINRILRIYPLYIFCISIIAFTHTLNGQTMFSLALLQTQDIPKNSPFPVLWSIQLEVACYLLFPIFLEAVRLRENLQYMFGAMLAIRMGMYFLPTALNWELSYSSIFGGATLFLSGMLAASIKNEKKFFLPLGIILFLMLSVFILKHGGFGGGSGEEMKFVWIFFPEIFSIIAFLVIKGALSFNSTGRISYLIAHIGRISYSGYVLHMFVLDFFLHFVGGRLNNSSLSHFFLSFSLYFVLLLILAHITYYAIELPFLKRRKAYI